jgi:thiol:disulfide interchange protein
MMKAVFPRFLPLACWIPAALGVLLLGTTVQAQVKFQDTLGIKPNRNAAQALAEFSARLVPAPDKPTEFVELQISATIPEEHYIYSTNPGNGAETKISLSKIGGLEVVDAAFEASPPPKPSKEEVFDGQQERFVEKVVEKHYEKVTWTRRFRILPNTKPAEIAVEGTVKYQICDSTTCRPNNKYEFSVKLTAGSAPGLALPTASNGPALSAPAAELPIAFEHRNGFRNDGPLIGRWIVAVQPRQARPGDLVTLSVTANLEKDWHTYALDQQQNNDGSGFLNTAIITREYGALIPQGGGFTGPAPQTRTSEEFNGLLEKYYEGSVRWERQFRIPDDTASGPIELAGDVGFQTCNAGQCLVSGFSFRGNVVVGGELIAEPLALAGSGPLKIREAKQTIEEGRSAPVPPAPASSTGELADSKPVVGPPLKRPHDANAEVARVGGINKGQGLFAFLLAAFVAGFAALLTPCVFPMVPITVSFFQKQSEKQHHRPVTMAAVYCLGIIGTFTGLGLLMSILFGATAVTTLANNPWINLVIAGVLVFFGLNLLGLFEIRVPSWLLTYSAGQESRGGFVGVLFMALTFTLTSFTCTFAFAGLLLAAAAQGDWLWPLLGLLAFSAAFSTPFFFLALFPSFLQKLPKNGGWMNTVKVVMGLIEVGAAFKFFSVADLSWHPTAWIFDYELVMSAWMVISITAGLYLLNMFRLPHDVATDHVGVLRFVFAMSFLGLAGYLGVGLYSAEKPTGKVWENIAAFAPPKFEGGNESYGPVIEHGGIKYALDYQRAIEFAARQNRPVFLDFTGVNCINCRKMEQTVLSSPEIIDRLKRFVCIQVFADQVPHVPDPAERERLLESNIRLQEWFGDASLPSYAVVPADKELTADEGNILSSVTGYSPDEQRFAKFLDDGLARWEQKIAQKNGLQIGQR